LDENEAYKAGLIVSVVMLASGFSLLFISAFTGYGAVILSLGVMTMIVVLMTKAIVVQIQKWMDYNARIEETVSNILTLREKGVPAARKVFTSKKPKVEEPKAEPEEEVEVVAS